MRGWALALAGQLPRPAWPAAADSWSPESLLDVTLPTSLPPSRWSQWVEVLLWPTLSTSCFSRPSRACNLSSVLLWPVYLVQSLQVWSLPWAPL